MEPLKFYAVLARIGVGIALSVAAVFLGWACWHFATFSRLVGISCACNYCPFVIKWWTWTAIAAAFCAHIKWTQYVVQRMGAGDSDLLLAEWIVFAPAIVCSFGLIAFFVGVGHAGHFPKIICEVAYAIACCLMLFPCENPISMLMLLAKRTRMWFEAHRKKRSARRVLLFSMGTVIVRGVFLIAAWLMFIGVCSHGIRGCASHIRHDILAEVVESESRIDSAASKEAMKNKDLIRRWIDDDVAGEEKATLKELFSNLHTRYPRSGYDLCLAEIMRETSSVDEAVLAECRKLYMDMTSGSGCDNVRALAMYQLGTLSGGPEAIRWYLKAVECGKYLGSELSVKALHDIAITPWKIDFSQCRSDDAIIKDSGDDHK